MVVAEEEAVEEEEEADGSAEGSVGRVDEMAAGAMMNCR